MRQHIDGHFSDVVDQNVDGGTAIRIGFDSHLASGRDRETGWYCYR